MADALIDKALIGTQGIVLTPSGDFRTVSGVLANFQTAQIRVLADIGSWLHDENFGSTIKQIFREKGAFTISEDDILSAVVLAVQPMLDDGRLSSVDAVSILDRQVDSIFIEIYVTAGTQKGKVPLSIS